MAWINQDISFSFFSIPICLRIYFIVRKCTVLWIKEQNPYWGKAMNMSRFYTLLPLHSDYNQSLSLLRWCRKSWPRLLLFLNLLKWKKKVISHIDCGGYMLACLPSGNHTQIFLGKATPLLVSFDMLLHCPL